jgi:hypothetical protein
LRGEGEELRIEQKKKIPGVEKRVSGREKNERESRQTKELT